MKAICFMFSFFCPSVLFAAYFEIVKDDISGVNDDEMLLKEELFVCDHDAICTHVHEIRNSRSLKLIRGNNDPEKMQLAASKIWKKTFGK